MDIKIQELDDGTVITMKVVPGSSGTTHMCGLLDGMLKIKVSAPPEKGKANQCLLKYLSRALDVKKNTLNIISGQTGRVKQVKVSGVSAEMLRTKLARRVRGIS